MLLSQSLIIENILELLLKLIIASWPYVFKGVFAPSKVTANDLIVSLLLESWPDRLSLLVAEFSQIDIKLALVSALFVEVGLAVANQVKLNMDGFEISVGLVCRDTSKGHIHMFASKKKRKQIIHCYILFEKDK